MRDTTVDFRFEGRASDSSSDEISWLVRWGSFDASWGVTETFACPEPASGWLRVYQKFE